MTSEDVRRYAVDGKRIVAGLIFGYEAVALLARCWPPLTTPLRAHPFLGSLVVGLLAHHLYPLAMPTPAVTAVSAALGYEQQRAQRFADWP